MPGDEDPIRIMVVDDHDLFRTGLCRLLNEEPGLHVVADARCGEEALRHAAELRPEVVVMDVNMPGMSGVEATRRLLAAPPAPAVLMLTVSDSEEAVLDAIMAGAAGYLLKGASLSEIVRGVRATASGESLIAPSVTGSLLARLRQHDRHEEPEAPPRLSPRELEVLRLMVAGHGNAEIGRRLHLSPSTIKNQVSSTLDKLGVENRIQAAVLAVRLGMLD